MKKLHGNQFFILLCVFALVLSVAASSEASSASDLRAARSFLKEASGLCGADYGTAEKSFIAAFHKALKLTSPNLSPSVREDGFALAAKCLHPSLFVEVRLAIETYLSIFPKGRHMVDVLIQKALLDYAEGKFSQAEDALTKAKELAEGKKVLRKIDALLFHGMIFSHKFRSAEAFLDSLQAEKKNSKLARDSKRFQTSEQRLQSSLGASKQAVSLEQETRDLRSAVENGYFAKSAPEAELTAISREDILGSMVYGREVTWFGYTRTSLHALSPQVRLEKLANFLDSFPEANPEMHARAILEMSNILRHEMKDPGGAESWLKYLAGAPEFAMRAKVEEALSSALDVNLADSKTPELLREISTYSAYLPYDNGWLPVVSPEMINELRIFASLVQGNQKEAAEILSRIEFPGKIRSIPIRIILLIACEMKHEADRLYKPIADTLTPQDRKFVEAHLYPVYRMVYPADLQILTATAVSARYPKIAVDLILKHLTTNPKILRLDHALALLSDLYLQNRSYIEAQSVWSTLRTLYPRSVWIK